ncbi:MAG: hypothetical protein CMJ19_12890 [Phycisphaeraceae bacterium]|nr:hypothetical protein [Phycisphaeraceae bacterium]
MAAKYQQIAQLVRTQVRDGEFTHRPVPSERQIAHSYGVSHMTARKATQELLSDGTLERLDNGRLAAARKAIAKIKGPKIALVSPSFDSESSRKVHMALEEVVEQRHGSLRPVGFTRLYDTIISEVLEADYDGIFLFPPRQTMPKVFLDMLKRHASRLAIVFRDMTREGLLSVGYRSPSDIQKVWEHLYELGHRRMAYLNTEPDLHNDRLHDTFENWCIAKDVTPVILCDPVESFQYSDIKAYEVMKRALEQGKLDGVTAMFGNNLTVTRAAIRAFYEQGMMIGKDISVCTQDLPRICRLSTPSITTLDLKPMNPLIEQVLDWFALGKAGKKQTLPQQMLHHPNVNVLVGESTCKPQRAASTRHTAKSVN